MQALAVTWTLCADWWNAVWIPWWATTMGVRCFTWLVRFASPCVCNQSQRSLTSLYPHAASEGQLAVLEYLAFLPGVDLNVADRFGGTPLGDALRERHTNVVEFLRARGVAEPQKKAEDEEVPLRFPCFMISFPLTSSLLLCFAATGPLDSCSANRQTVRRRSGW